MNTWIINYSSILLYSTFFVVSFIFSLMINMLFLRFFKTLGIRNNSDGTVIRWGTMSKPSVGGITFYIIFLLSVASYSILFEPGKQIYQLGFVGLLISCASGFLIGLADDAYDTRPVLKFGVQVLCGVLLIGSGIYIQIFPSQEMNYLFTIFWVVGIMNSINMLDNMDGITTVVSIGILLNTVYRIVRHNDLSNMHLLVMLGVLASLFAFLRFNWNPSLMYMGDTGSQFLGVFLATMGIIYFWNDPYAISVPATGKLFVTTIMTFILPILDTTVVVVNRLLKKQSPFIGGKDHTTHSLAYLGLSDRQVAITFVGLASMSFFINILLEEYLTDWSYIYSIVFSLYLLGLMVFFFYTTRNQKFRETTKKNVEKATNTSAISNN